ncbi:MAG: CHASE2 domain-containing protein [Calothrix sp. MO_167.B12]|nr:CHASE2 domain-containing protein [Calothrix sp. MO_167.B12]
MTFIRVFQLKILKLSQYCHFELSWGKGLTISAKLDYPTSLEISYADWRQAYLNCYENLRGKVVKKGKIKAPPQDWQGKLREAEACFLSEFHLWLRNKQLYEIRETIADAARDIPNSDNHWVDVLLTCNTPELARLPWEAWEINTKLSAPGTRTIRLARVPDNIRYATISPVRRKARVLAILGDDKGLDFEEDKQALRGFSNVAEVKFTGWQPGKDIAQLKQEIAEKICDRKGWDILFFAGHSNETSDTGGELSIAPQVSIAIKDIVQPLQQARDRGLQFAIFNSCSGISIAESLIDLGLPQVAVMREPIHNQVAQEFLVQFLNSLAEYKDVHEALLDACAFLKEQKNLTYPSTYLIPSLFRHPQSELFRLEPFGVWHSIKSWLPTKKEGVYLVAFLTLSIIPPVQDFLLEPRLLLQSAYRQFTQGTENVLPPPNQQSPVLLVQIDKKSLAEDKVRLVNERYMDYGYLSRIVDKLVQRNARLIGVDYILDRDKEQPDNSIKLKQSIDKAINKGTWFVWGANEADKEGISPDIANLNQSMAGDINLYDWYVELPKNNCSDTCPFAYLLALSDCLLSQDIYNTNLLQPQLSTTNFRDSVVSSINTKDKQTDFLKELKFPAINNFFQWFQPIIDYSIPPKQAYETISACELLGSCTPTPAIAQKDLKSKILIIAAGGYKQAGVNKKGEDNAYIPLPVAFWRGAKGWNDWFNGEKSFTGGEAHAYTVHHLLNQHLVVPIPNFFMVLVGAVLGKIIRKILQHHPRGVRLGLIGFGTTTVVYVFVSLQVYISLAVLVPIVFPLAVLGNYLRLALGKK